MNILYIEPYNVGSHKQWIEGYANNSSNSIDIIDLKPSKWKWRMHGGAITLSDKYKKINKKYDLIICSDYLNLPVFKSLCLKKLSNTPIITYFHENQLTYPWSPHDKDKSLQRDLHYHFINYSTSLVSDWNLFNSKYHMNIYFDYLKTYLKKMPDYNNITSIDTIMNKSDVLYLGCDLKKLRIKKTKENRIPIVLWNHRWEYDKNPELFFTTLQRIQNKKIKFKLVVIGKSFDRFPDIFTTAKKSFKKNIIQFGYCDSPNDYIKFLNIADIVPITSNQDFFGISALEAVYCGAYPLLPNRLSFPEIFDINNNSELFYTSDDDFYRKLLSVLSDHHKLKNKSKLIEGYDWSVMANKYDLYIEKMCESLTFST